MKDYKGKHDRDSGIRHETYNFEEFENNDVIDIQKTILCTSNEKYPLWNENESNATNNFGNAVLSTDASDGSYTLPWLTVGTYDLIVVAYNNIGEFENILGYINDINIVTGETTTQDITDDTLLDALP